MNMIEIDTHGINKFTSESGGRVVVKDPRFRVIPKANTVLVSVLSLCV